MTDSIIDDVNALLEGDFGDDRILKQIHRACENGEIISNYERRYVRDLAGKHMGQRSAEPVAEAPPVPDVVIPAFRPQVLSTPVKRRRPSSKIIIIIIVALAVIIPAATFFESYEPGAAPTKMYVRTDKTSYAANEVIAIYGISDGSGKITISITNEDGKTEWSYDADIKDRLSENTDGYKSNYSTLTAADPAWEGSGTFTVTADDGTTKESATFSFTK
ncbi:MAG: hypothetical protein D9C04_00940 [Nitrosopumilus sp. B06]|nr:MAG: hypothetical protein EB828_01105 [Nitrosopumilus sp. D6]RNJ80588.1 MAG: hypothetical protein D9C04_00940 [Nitrosopumilus sp. B06]